MHNPLSILISIINNGIKSNKKYVFLPFDQTILNIIAVFYSRGYITSYKVYNYYNNNITKSYICVWLKRYKNKNVINFIKMYSKPSRNIFMSYKELTYLKQKQQIELLISTSFGYKWLHECLFLKIGGLVLFELL